MAKGTVLFVDDEIGILNAVKRLLRKEEYEIVAISEPEEALKLLESGKEIDVIVSDYRMPQINGVEFLKKAKVLAPDTVRIVLTGFSDVTSIVNAINEGEIYKFLSKPWNDDELKINIRHAIELCEIKKENKRLYQQITDQNTQLKYLNENLETLVEEKTYELRIRNQILELSQQLLDSLPIGVVGIDNEGMVVKINEEAERILNPEKRGGLVSMPYSVTLPPPICEAIQMCISTNSPQIMKQMEINSAVIKVKCFPFGKIEQGIILILEVLQNKVMLNV